MLVTPIDKSDWRRSLALVSLIGGAVTMTAYAAYALWEVRTNPGYVFYLGVFAHVQILLVLAGITGLLVRRNLEISKGKIVISDHDEDEDDLIPRSEAVTAVEEASLAVTEAVEEIPAVTPTNGTNDQSR